VFKSIITAAGIALMLATTTQGFAQDASRAPASADILQTCQDQAVTEEAKHSAETEARLASKGVVSATNQTITERESIERRFLADGDYFILVRVARCLAANKHFDEAIAIMKPIVGYYGEDGQGFANPNAKAVNFYPYQAWHDYALILDAKGDRKGAGHAMTIAYTLSKEVYADKEMLPDYKRLAAANIATAQTQQRKTEAVDQAARIARSRKFWDACSADQRRILVMKGGTHTNRDHNVGEHWGPDRIQSYDTANYHQETWWYYGLQGPHSAEAFTFHNGRLVSHYQA
jgi:hypothetical protein